jgi:hypothetical protein
MLVRRFIEAAESGQLVPPKYLFEAVAWYPPTAETSAKLENSLAYTLLKRMGLPTDPINCEKGPMVSMTSVAKPATREASEAGADSVGEKGRESTAGRMPE